MKRICDLFDQYTALAEGSTEKEMCDEFAAAVNLSGQEIMAMNFRRELVKSHAIVKCI